MENPEQDIHRVLEGLFHGSVAEQTATVAAYYLPDASLTGSCSRVPSFASLPLPWAEPLNSAWAILMTYRLYRIVFPRIEFRVESCAFDQSACILYLSLRQTLSTWLLPVRARSVRSVSVLQLRPLDRKGFAPDSANPVRDASGCDGCSALAGAGEKGDEGVLYFIAGRRDFLRDEDVAVAGSAWSAAKVLVSVFYVAVAVVCMPVYCALWPGWVSGARSGRGVQGG